MSVVLNKLSYMVLVYLGKKFIYSFCYYIMKIKFVRLSEEVVLPSFKRKWDAWMDIRSMEKLTLKAWDSYQFRTWLQIELPAWTVWLINGRSWLAVKHWIDTIWNVIDENYRWEFSCILVNNWSKDFEVNVWDRIAQLLVMPIFSNNLTIEEALELSENEDRWDAGFGSSWVA